MRLGPAATTAEALFEQRLAGLKDLERAGRPRRFPPEQVAGVKALACELPATHGLPLGRFSRTELHRLVVERGFSIVQRKALAPNDFGSLDALAERLLRFDHHYRQIAQPFRSTFTRTDLEHLLTRIDAHQPQLRLAAQNRTCGHVY